MSRLLLPIRHLAELTDFVSRRIGLHFSQHQQADLERGIMAAGQELGFSDRDAFVERLLTRPLSRAEIETLAGHLTVGETYLMREGKSFEALGEKVLPEIIAARRGGERILRLWSAGCSSGEEVYSLAITVARVLPDWRDWRISILGTDINPTALRKAAEGIYGEWSFRMTPPWVKEGYFEPAGPKRYRVKSALRQMVSFEYLNLADDVYPSLLTRTNAMDVIFCRNVLLYFSEERARQVTERFRRALVDGGWLVGGLAEQFQAPGFVRMPFEGTALFRNAKPADPVCPPPPRTPAISAPARPAEPALPAVAPTPVAKVVARPSPVELARSCANAGRLAEALAHCDEAVAREKMHAAHHYLRATILTELGRLTEARESLRRALYLDPGFLLAHFTFATIARKQGRESESQRHLDQALALLSGFDPRDLVPESDGITVGRFAEIIKATMSSQAAPPSPSTPHGR